MVEDYLSTKNNLKVMIDIILKLANLDKDIKLGNVNGEVGLEFLLLSI